MSAAIRVLNVQQIGEGILRLIGMQTKEDGTKMTKVS
jgi:hypothetical protein